MLQLATIFGYAKPKSDKVISSYGDYFRISRGTLRLGQGGTKDTWHRCWRGRTYFQNW